MSTHRRSAAAARGSDPATPPKVGREQLPGRSGLATPALLLFASGTAALVYQVVWIKQLSLVVGVDIYAVTTGVSAFFVGLALGGLLFGWSVDRWARPLLLYAFLELSVAVLSVATTLVLAHAAFPFVALEARAPSLAWALLFALVAVPAVLMGGTLPVLIRSRAPQAGQVAAAGGHLSRGQYRGCDRRCPLDLVCPHPPVGRSGHGVRRSCDQPGSCGRSAWTRSCHMPLALAGPVPKLTRLASEARIALMLYAVAGGIAQGYEVVCVVPGNRTIHEHRQLRLLCGPGDVPGGSRHRQHTVCPLGGSGPRSLGSLRSLDRGGRSRGAA